MIPSRISASAGILAPVGYHFSLLPKSWRAPLASGAGRIYTMVVRSPHRYYRPRPDIQDLRMKELTTKITRKGQITLPAEIRRYLGVKEGDKVGVSPVDDSDGQEPRVIVRAVRSVA